MTSETEPTPAPPVAAEPVDHAKVERIRQAIDAGTYVVDPDATADKMIDAGFPNAIN